MKELLYRNIVIMIYFLFSPLVGWGQNYEVITLAGGKFCDGPTLEEKLYQPCGIAVDNKGNVYFTDSDNNKICKISSEGVLSILAGSGEFGYADGIGNAAMFKFPTDVAIDNAGNLFVADAENHRIRKISPSGVVTTFAGSGIPGNADGIGNAASFTAPTGIAVGSDGYLYVADTRNALIRKISPSGKVTTLAGSGTDAYADGIGIAASFDSPTGVAVDDTGNVFVGDCGNHRIRKISKSGVVSTIAGGSNNIFSDGTGSEVSFSFPGSLAVDRNGNIYVADEGNNCIRKINSKGEVTTIAGSRTLGYKDGVGTAARFKSPTGVAVDSVGNIYVADGGNHYVRKIVLLPK
jgi:sugar lactone lactonase YvrE